MHDVLASLPVLRVFPLVFIFPFNKKKCKRKCKENNSDGLEIQLRFSKEEKKKKDQLGMFILARFVDLLWLVAFCRHDESSISYVQQTICLFLSS